MRRITIMDNDSSYPPLLEWYGQLPEWIRVDRNPNQGPWAFWDRAPYPQNGNPYIVTDSDVVPTSTCPGDLVDKLVGTLQEFRWAAKVGPGIRIDDLPETPWREDILRYEKRYWRDRLRSDCFSGAIDTTFAVYRKGFGGTAMGSAIRLDHPYVVEHLPWYVWPPSEEERYYRQHADHEFSSSTAWMTRRGII
jgi:hypothetical protein